MIYNMQPIIYKKERNGLYIIVRSWSNTITLSDAKTHKVVRQLEFSNHINALFFAKKLANSK